MRHHVQESRIDTKHQPRHLRERCGTQPPASYGWITYSESCGRDAATQQELRNEQMASFLEGSKMCSDDPTYDRHTYLDVRAISGVCKVRVRIPSLRTDLSRADLGQLPYNSVGSALSTLHNRDVAHRSRHQFWELDAVCSTHTIPTILQKGFDAASKHQLAPICLTEFGECFSC